MLLVGVGGRYDVSTAARSTTRRHRAPTSAGSLLYCDGLKQIAVNPASTCAGMDSIA